MKEVHFCVCMRSIGSQLGRSRACRPTRWAFGRDRATDAGASRKPSAPNACAVSPLGVLWPADCDLESLQAVPGSCGFAKALLEDPSMDCM